MYASTPLDPCARLASFFEQLIHGLRVAIGVKTAISHERSQV